MKELLRPTALSALLALAPLCAPAQTPDTHRHRFGDAEKWAKVFDDPERDAWQKPHEVIEVLALAPDAVVADIGSRSEEHTSELQSRRDLVCRLLLEKKKKKKKNTKKKKKQKQTKKTTKKK